MNYKKWFIGTLILISIPLGSLAGFNYFIDPLWTFNHANKFNQVQEGFNERQQKTNYITFNKFDYDTLILGSSRTSYINQKNFIGFDAYNYAVSSMAPEEYYDYIEYAKEKKGEHFKYIIIGLDFFGTNESNSSIFKQADYYTNISNSKLYRWKNLISLDVYERSKTNLEWTLNNNKSIPRYNRENIKSIEEITEKEKKERIDEQLLHYKDIAYANYKYKNMKDIFLQLKNENPETEFIVFTTPVTTDLFKVMVNSGLLDNYNRWLYDAISVFGGVYNFMYPNSVTNKTINYVDAHHFKPEIGTFIANKISGYNNKDIPEDFGVFVTEDNINEHLRFIKHTLQ